MRSRARVHGASSWVKWRVPSLLSWRISVVARFVVAQLAVAQLVVAQLVVAPFLVACDRQPAADARGAASYGVDDFGDSLRPPARAQRIVSLAPATTEILF